MGEHERGCAAEARWEIVALLHRYAELVDRGDFAGVADLLGHATLTADGAEIRLAGRDDMLAFFQGGTKVYSDTGTPKTQHVFSNPIVDVDLAAGTATCRSYLTVFQAVEGVFSLQPVLTARYHDEFVRVDDAWRFATRHGFMDLVGNLTSHLKDEFRPMWTDAG